MDRDIIVLDMKQLIPILAFVLTLITVSNCSIQRRFFFNGALFEGDVGESPFVDFSNIKKDEWKNLNSTVSKHNLLGKEHFCSIGPGGWIGYPNASFTHGETHYIIIVGPLCVHAEHLNSIQPIGFLFGNQDSNLALFTKVQFESEVKLLYKGETSGDFKSIIYMGDHGATLEGTGEKGKIKYCLLRSFEEANVCLLPDVVANLGLKNSQVTVKHGCDFIKDDLTIHYLQNCYSEGVHMISLQTDLKLAKMQEICKGGGAASDKDQFAQIMDVWKTRILYGSEEFGTVHLKNIEAYPKVEAFLQFLDIFIMGCPTADEHYLSLLGHIFLNHLKAVWDANPNMIGPDYDSQYAIAFDYISHCWSATMNMGHFNMDNAPCGIRQAMGGTGDPDIASPLDSVIEQVFWMLNYITPHCNHVGDYRTNEWMIFPEMFKQVYFQPIEEQWINPGIWEKIYPIMFHGYNYKEMVTQIFTCAAVMDQGITMGEFSAPVSRTPGFDKFNSQKDSNEKKPGDKSSPPEDSSQSESPEQELPPSPENAEEDDDEIIGGGGKKREINEYGKGNKTLKTGITPKTAFSTPVPQGLKVNKTKKHHKKHKGKGHKNKGKLSNEIDHDKKKKKHGKIERSQAFRPKKHNINATITEVPIPSTPKPEKKVI